MVNLEKERGRPYYVFNDFYENEYPANLSCKIFCLKERETSDWKKYSEKEFCKNNSGCRIYKFSIMRNVVY